jgi:hypothetical protein
MAGRECFDFPPKPRGERWALFDIIKRKRNEAILALTRRY